MSSSSFGLHLSVILWRTSCQWLFLPQTVFAQDGVRWTLACCTSGICSSPAPAESIKVSTVTMVLSWPSSTCTFTHTNMCLVIQEGPGGQTHTHTCQTPDPAQIGTFLTPKWDPQLFPRLRALFFKESCYVSGVANFLYVLQRSANMLSTPVIDVRFISI